MFARAQSPDWYLLLAALVALSALGFVWAPLFAVVPVLVVALAALVGQAAIGAASAIYPGRPESRLGHASLRALTALLSLLGPCARLAGRFAEGLTPWRMAGTSAAWPRPRSLMIWTTRPRAASDRLRAIEAALRARRVPVRRGGGYDRWDLEVRGGILAGARVRMGTEDHPGGAQLVRVRSWPRPAPAGLAVMLLLAALAATAASQHGWPAAALLGAAAVILAVRCTQQCAVACGAVAGPIEGERDGTDPG
jgi:hypothetical protein